MTKGYYLKYTDFMDSRLSLVKTKENYYYLLLLFFY